MSLIELSFYTNGVLGLLLIITASSMITQNVLSFLLFKGLPFIIGVFLICLFIQWLRLYGN